MSSVPSVISFPFSVNSKELCPAQEILAQHSNGLFLLASALERNAFMCSRPPFQESNMPYPKFYISPTRKKMFIIPKDIKCIAWVRVYGYSQYELYSLYQRHTLVLAYILNKYLNLNSKWSWLIDALSEIFSWA